MRKIATLLLSFLLFGCATTLKPVSLNPTFWQNREKPLGIAVTKSEPPTAYMTGNQGLLDIAINRGNASKLIDYLAKLDLPKLNTVPDSFSSQLQARSFKVKKIAEPIDTSKLSKFSGKSESSQFAELDYRKFKDEGIERLLLISVERVGTTRNYYGFIPTNPPQAELALKGQLIDLNTNELLWYTNDTYHQPIADPWEQAGFENVTAAINANNDQGIEKFEQSLFAGPVQ